MNIIQNKVCMPFYLYFKGGDFYILCMVKSDDNGLTSSNLKVVIWIQPFCVI
jgi:hypothetical protein